MRQAVQFNWERGSVDDHVEYRRKQLHGCHVREIDPQRIRVFAAEETAFHDKYLTCVKRCYTSQRGGNNGKE
jgi:hypothetical protein